MRPLEMFGGWVGSQLDYGLKIKAYIIIIMYCKKQRRWNIF